MKRLWLVRIGKICRGWFNNYCPNCDYNNLNLKPTYLSAHYIENINVYSLGLLILLNNEEVNIIDNRELSSCYIKKTVNKEKILTLEPLTNDNYPFNKDLPIYYYSSICKPISTESYMSENYQNNEINYYCGFNHCINYSFYSTDKHPIVQSYVDICCRAFLLLDKIFDNDNYQLTREFINTCYYWSEHWVNDRIFPYRPFHHEKSATIINKILEDELGFLLKKIKISH
jgi:hypothetical protein